MEIIKFSELKKNQQNFGSEKDSEFDADLFRIVQNILLEVRKNGLSACIDFTRKFDRVELNKNELVVNLDNPGKKEINDPLFEEAVQEAITNISNFHQKQAPIGFRVDLKDGGFQAERWVPLDRVGCYVPGGVAPLISTVLMTVIPAKIAGVKSINVCTPPDQNGKVNPYILEVCRKLGVDSILKIGGAQGIAAMAFGLELFPPVLKIVGPGNRFVTEAKRQLFGIVDIDMLAGPSEICILADASSDPGFIASDLLSQLEHDSDAFGIVISDSRGLFKKIEKKIFELLKLPELKTLSESSFENLKFISVKNIEEGLEAVDWFSPEHLEVMVQSPEKFFTHPFKAGAVFFGNYTPVVVGDLFGGTNHVLPTNRRARFSSPLSVYDFFRRTHYLQYSRNTLLEKGSKIEYLAQKEELPAHKNSITIRLNRN